MTSKEFCNLIGNNTPSGPIQGSLNKFIQGGSLNKFYDQIKELPEIKGCELSIIEEVYFSVPKINYTKTGIEVESTSDPKLANYADPYRFKGKIELYSIFTQDDHVIFRVSESTKVMTKDEYRNDRINKIDGEKGK